NKDAAIVIDDATVGRAHGSEARVAKPVAYGGGLSWAVTPKGRACARPFSTMCVRSAGVDLQALRPGRVAQLEQRHFLDLPDPLPGQAELAAHLVQGALPAVVQAEAQPDDCLLALGQGGQDD